ncbi:MAG: secondary thiamine-phosphate synthase enzyme YjbQ, partial [archaeon GBS-70-058]|nr:secondary thiamine-phosphate synthase enzyme YjbQ [Candidatus Culexarchaeum nevadense]
MIRVVNVRSKGKVEFIDVTDIINNAIKGSVEEGVCHIYSPHTTAGLTINEGYDENVVRDIIETLNKIVPEGQQYRHLEGNAPAHIKTSLIGSSLLIPISNGRLMLGRWQRIFLCEF